MDIEEILIANNIFEDLQDAEEQAEIPTRRFKKRESAFELSDAQFRKCFRVSKELAREIIETISPYIQQATRSSALDISTKVNTVFG